LIASAPADDRVFAGNRAVGRIALAVGSGSTGSRRQRVHEAGSLRVRFPNSVNKDILEAVIVNTAGGMTGGDRFDVDVTVAAGAQVTVTTAAAEKVYRSTGPETAVGVKLNVAAGGMLAWLPQQTILFDRVRLRRTIDVDLAPGAGIVLAEAVVFGRAAMGETVRDGYFFDRWRVRIGGTLVFAESLRLDGAVAAQLAQPSVARGGIAIATVLKIPGGESDADAVRALEKDLVAEASVSAWNGLAVARLAAPSGEALQRDLVGVLTALGGMPLPRLWLN